MSSTYLRCTPILALLAILATAVSMPAWAAYTDCPPMASGSHMRPDNRYFDVYPRIVPANQENVVEIVPRFEHCQFKPDCTYELVYAPTEQVATQSGWVPDKKTPITPVDGRYQFKMFFEGEQEHVLYIEEIAKDKRKAFGDFRVYSLESDLYALRPFKGDFHMHSCRSDGVESPAYVAGICRRVGLDFMALTDHRTYEGSTEAQNAFKDVDIDLRIYNGEEVHAPDNPVHIVSFGASGSISAFYKDENANREEVKKLAETLPELPAGVNRYQYASCLWVFNKIHELGGLGMFAHHYWFTSHKFTPAGALTSHLFDTQAFDVLELISGFDKSSMTEADTNLLQVARYQEERAKGRKIPIAGISDTHGHERSETFGRYYTVVFAPTSDLVDIKAGIMDLRSVAVEAVGGELPRSYGPFRLVKYNQFLLREVFPQHDELCFEEGRLMIQYASGDKKAAKELHRLKGRIADLYEHFWSTPKEKK